MKKGPFQWLLYTVISGLFSYEPARSQNLLPPLQPEQDACNALYLCGNQFFTPYSYQGPGRITDLTTTPCGAGEANVMWLKLTIATPGSLAFRIIPKDTTDDYDFAVLDGTNADCNNLPQSSVVRCNFNSNLPGSNKSGIVGLSDTATLDNVQGGSTGYSFARSIPATANQTYLIMINNFGSDEFTGPSAGFTIDFSPSTATFASETAPGFKNIINTCSDSTILVQLTKPILCNSIAPDGSDFSLTPSVMITDASGVNCVGGNGYTSQVIIHCSGHLDRNTHYQLNARSGSDGNTLLDLCNGALVLTNSSSTSSLPFIVPPVVREPFLPPDTTKCSYNSLTIGPGSPFAQYEWNTGQTTASININTPGEYTLQVVDTNGCQGLDSIAVKDSACPQYVYLPSAFTPNGDGKNDLFRPVFAGAVTYFEFSIYDRWGREVFKSEDPSRGWDGSQSGRSQPAGAYVWVCSYKLYQQPDRVQKGTVILIR